MIMQVELKASHLHHRDNSNMFLFLSLLTHSLATKYDYFPPCVITLYKP